MRLTLKLSRQFRPLPPRMCVVIATGMRSVGLFSYPARPSPSSLVGESRETAGARASGPQLLSHDSRVANTKRNVDSVLAARGRRPAGHRRGTLSAVVAAIARQAWFNRVQPRHFYGHFVS